MGGDHNIRRKAGSDHTEWERVCWASQTSINWDLCAPCRYNLWNFSKPPTKLLPIVFCVRTERKSFKRILWTSAPTTTPHMCLRDRVISSPADSPGMLLSNNLRIIPTYLFTFFYISLAFFVSITIGNPLVHCGAIGAITGNPIVCTFTYKCASWH